MPTNFESVAEMIQLLEREQVAYMLVGSLAGNLYGLPRATQDADLVAEISASQIHAISEMLSTEIVMDRQLSFEAITGTTRRMMLTLKSKFVIEIFEVGDDPHHRERFARRLRIPVRDLGIDVWVSTAEDMLIQKLRWGRGKDLDDAVGIVAISGQSLDWEYIHRWVDEHGTRPLLRQVQEDAE